MKYSAALYYPRPNPSWLLKVYTEEQTLHGQTGFQYQLLSRTAAATTHSCPFSSREQLPVGKDKVMMISPFWWYVKMGFFPILFVDLNKLLTPNQRMPDEKWSRGLAKILSQRRKYLRTDVCWRIHCQVLYNISYRIVLLFFIMRSKACELFGKWVTSYSWDNSHLIIKDMLHRQCVHQGFDLPAQIWQE